MKNNISSKKIIIFDWGGVCTSGHLLKVFSSKLSGLSGLKEELIEKTFRDFEYPYETGKIRPIEFWKKFRNKLKINYPVQKLQKLFFSSYIVNQDVLEYILILKEKYRLIMFTNNYADMFQHLKNAYDLNKYFNEIFSSSDIKYKKPEKAAYEYVINKLRCKPNETIFVDDSIKNIIGAKEFGFKTILFKNIEELKEKLASTYP